MSFFSFLFFYFLIFFCCWGVIRLEVFYVNFCLLDCSSTLPITTHPMLISDVDLNHILCNQHFRYNRLFKLQTPDTGIYLFFVALMHLVFAHAACKWFYVPKWLQIHYLSRLINGCSFSLTDFPAMLYYLNLLKQRPLTKLEQSAIGCYVVLNKTNYI